MEDALSQLHNDVKTNSKLHETCRRESGLLLQKSFAAAKALFVNVNEVVHGARIRIVDDSLFLRIEATEKVNFTFGVSRLPATQIFQIVLIHAENKIESLIIFELNLPSHVTHRNSFALHEFLSSFVRTISDFCIDRKRKKKAMKTRSPKTSSQGGIKQT